MKTLLYFTAEYPYGVSEQFIEEEIVGLASLYDKVVLIPLRSSNSVVRDVPSNTSVSHVLREGALAKVQLKFKDKLMLLKIILIEILMRKQKVYAIKNIRRLLAELKKSHAISVCIYEGLIKDSKEDLSFYSTWMNENTLALTLLKLRGEIKKFTFKMRGFDLFDFRKDGEYMPWRYNNFKAATSILTMSKDGRDYLKKKNIFPNKINHNFPGIQSGKFIGPIEGVFTICSCSNMYELKRNSAIAEALRGIEFPVKWIHFGDGKEMQKVKEVVATLPKNVEVELRGNTSNREILQFYENTKVDAFIHVSSTEGFGYSIIEAYCFGIPAILYPAGGVNDLIHKDFAVSVERKFSAEAVSVAIVTFRNEFYMKRNPRLAAFNFQLSTFNPENQTAELYDFIEEK